MSEARPASTGELFSAFTWLSLQGFGGVLAVAQRELVERHRWLTKDEFVEMLSVGQVLPGPNVCNLALMIGDRYFGWRGAFAALAGMLAVPLVIVVALAALYGQLSAIPAVAGALRGMGAVAAGLIIATGFKLCAALKSNPLGIPVCMLPFGGYLVLPLAIHLSGCLGDATIAWHTLRAPAGALCEDMRDGCRFWSAAE